MTPELARAAPTPAPAAAPAARPLPEAIAVPDLDFEPEPEPVRAAPIAPPAPIEISEEPAAEPELAPMHEFVPAAATTGHRPEPIAAAAAHPAAVPQGGAGVVTGMATAADGGEAALREALSRASREVIERVVWEVVPQLAETIIRENLDRLTRARQG